MKAASARIRPLAKARGRALSLRELAARVKAGLPLSEFDALRRELDVTVEDLADRIGISIATLSRRRRTGEPLDPGHSDRLLRYARLLQLATALYNGNEEAGRTWLRKPARALGGERPLDHAGTEIGARAVEDLIGRLEHGVYT
jgi:putative toxin-antitoxin system antitoxin component (TIGR02293 family)